VKASVVIGAGAGDEGKGLITDLLASRQPSVVVRFNGGAQAGHTVVTHTGRRHVFQHVGAGALTGAGTFLARRFIVNPIFFVKEYRKLVGHGVYPDIAVDPDCLVTVPWDLMINHAIEKKRGDGRHGSCGAGIFETVVRSGMVFVLTAADLINQKTLKNKLQFIRHKYVPERMEELGLDELHPQWKDDGIIEQFLKDCALFRDVVRFFTWRDYASRRRDEHFIFEGAQGLLLDAKHENFPHVTPSRTGLPNVVELAKEVGITDLDVYYVSRTYLTRHGAGPLPLEWTSPPAGITDSTNVENEHQGKLRYAPICYRPLVKRIKDDLLHADRLKTNPKFVLTHLDQTEDKVETVLGRIEADAVAELVLKQIGGKSYLLSRGPTRETITEVNCRKQLDKPVPTNTVEANASREI
jgi:adenylosuccinate synthase